MAKSKYTPPRPGAVARKLASEIAGLGGLRLVDKQVRNNPRVIPTGVDSIDVATGVGGYVEGRIVLNHGPEAVGKTTQALLTAAQVQRMGGIAVYFDIECKLDIAWAKTLGVDTTTLIRNDYELKYIEDVFDRIDKVCVLAREDDPEIPIYVVFDSMQSANSIAEDKRGYADTGFSAEARAFNRCLRRVVPTIAGTRSILNFLSQVRMDVGNPVPNAQKIGVGKAVGHAATMIFQWRQAKAMGKVGAAIEAEARYGNETEVVVKKNQVAPPFQVARFPILYAVGVDIAGDVLSAAKAVGLAEQLKAGYWNINFPSGERKVRGPKGLGELALNKPEEFDALRQAIRGRIGKYGLEVDPEEAAKGPALDDETAEEATA